MDFNAKELFLKLTETTVPRGYEHEIVKNLPDYVKNHLQEDGLGNWYMWVGKEFGSRTIFTSHLDTVSHQYKKVNHVIDGKWIKTDGTSTLGADDKAGAVAMCALIKAEVPGLYYFFYGEESGCMGSRKVAAKKDVFNADNFDHVISFDRYGEGSIITHQGSWCTSEEFCNTLIEEFKANGMSFYNDDGGIYTDSAQFISSIPECTNLSVGYEGHHSNGEKQDIEYLQKLCDTLPKINWAGLPAVRDYTKRISKWDRVRYNEYDQDDDIDEDFAYGFGSSAFSKRDPKEYFWNDNEDDDYDNDDDYEDVEDFHSIIAKHYGGDSNNTPSCLYYDISTGKEYYEFEPIIDLYLNDGITESELEDLKSFFLEEDKSEDLEIIKKIEESIKYKNSIA